MGASLNSCRQWCLENAQPCQLHPAASLPSSVAASDKRSQTVQQVFHRYMPAVVLDCSKYQTRLPAQASWIDSPHFPSACWLPRTTGVPLGALPMRESHSCPQASSPHIAALDVQEKSFSHLITGYASISETNRRQKHVPKISECNPAGTSCGKPFRTGDNRIHVKLQQIILASSLWKTNFRYGVSCGGWWGIWPEPNSPPLMPPIKSANCLCFKLSSKLCLNCNLEEGHQIELKMPNFLVKGGCYC